MYNEVKARGDYMEYNNNDDYYKELTNVQPIGNKPHGDLDMVIELNGSMDNKKKEELRNFVHQIALDPSSLQTIEDIELFNELSEYIYTGEMKQYNNKNNMKKNNLEHGSNPHYDNGIQNQMGKAHNPQTKSTTKTNYNY